MLARLRAFFNARPCETCEALRGTIQVMRDHEAFLCGQLNILQDALLRATRVAPPTPRTRVEGENPPEAVSSLPPSWNTVRRKLEEKHRRKPEDQVAEHWQGKIDELEKEAGIQTQAGTNA